jgi:dihydroxyacid dehydratase/phosphogluconate dehydratase
MHINKLADEAEKGVNSAGGKGVIFNTITISDGISMGSEGMKYSLVSRIFQFNLTNSMTGKLPHCFKHANNIGVTFTWLDSATIVRAGEAVLTLLEKDIKPSDIMTMQAFENAITVIITLGGSTNAVLHLIAMANAIGVNLTIDDFTRIGADVPVIADLKPSGKYMMSELVEIGGTLPLMKMLLDAGLLHGDCMTVTGKTMAQNLKAVKPYADSQEIIKSLDNPIKKDSHLRILRGNLAQEGAVAKITGKEGLSFKGSSTTANTPPLKASGVICPTTKPWAPPEKRPSVISATLPPKPLPMTAEVGASISRIPGPPAGPS